MSETVHRPGKQPGDRPGTLARALMRRAGRAGLATTLARDGDAWPYGSLVLIAVDHDASPLLLLSDLADHTHNIKADPRVALLFDGTAGWRDPLAGPRVSVLGRARRSDDPRLLARFVARHEGAEVYAGFKDFHLYRVAMERAHLVAGFGAIHWLAREEVLYDSRGAEAFAVAEASIVDHMNRDHGQALDLIAEHILKLPGQAWVMIGLDPEGCDLRSSEHLARLDFDRAVRDAEGARDVLVRLTKRAREIAAAA